MYKSILKCDRGKREQSISIFSSEEQWLSQTSLEIVMKF